MFKNIEESKMLKWDGRLLELATILLILADKSRDALKASAVPLSS